MNLKASIDIGTNSTRLLIAEVKAGGRIEPLVYDERLTKLGAGLTADGNLDKAALERVLAALLEYRAQIAAHHVHKAHVLATSATRDARNQKEFLQKIKQETSFDCRVLTGEEEARLSILGAISDLTPPTDYLVCDVGGGSSEFIFANENKIQSAASLDIGSGRLTRRFLHHDPPHNTEISEFSTFVHEHLKANFADHPPVTDIIALGGTAATLALIATGAPISDPYRAHHYRLSVADLQDLILDLAEKNQTHRQTITGLHPDRADVILGGALLFAEILDYFNCASLLVSLRDLMFGVMVE